MVIINGYSSGTSRWNRCFGQGIGKTAQSSHVLLECVTLPKYPWVHQPRISQKSLFCVFMEASGEHACLVAQFCLPFCSPMDCSLPGSTVHGFSRQEYWSEFPHLPPEDLPDLGMEPESLTSPALAGGFFTTSTT